MLVSVEVQEELFHLVDDFGDPGVGAVDLVDHEYDRQASGEGLAEYEARLGQRALGGVDEQEDPVDHGEPPLDLAAEVGVARGVDDVELHTAVAHGGVLGQDRDALLTLEIARVEDSFVHVLVRSECARLPEHGVDQCGLAVVDVGHNCHISDVVSSRHGLFNLSAGPGVFQTGRPDCGPAPYEPP